MVAWKENKQLFQKLYQNLLPHNLHGMIDSSKKHANAENDNYRIKCFNKDTKLNQIKSIEMFRK